MFGEHPTEHLVVVAEIDIHRIRNPIPAVVAPVVVATAPEQDKLLRIFHRQQPQQDLVDQAEDGCVRADAQCERKNGNYNKYRRLLKSAKSETEVLPEMSHNREYSPERRTLRIGRGWQKLQSREAVGQKKRNYRLEFL
jgi:hypothetical protein